MRDIEINGKNWKGLIDTGACVSVLDFRVVKSLDLANKLKTRNINDLQSASGDPIRTLGLVKLDVSIQSKSFAWDFTVCKSLTHMIIIGLDLITAHFSNISFKNNVVELNNINKIEISQYSTLFKFSKADYGISNVDCERCIELYQPFTIFAQPYQYNTEMKAIIEEKINDLLANNIIEKSEANFASPIVMIKKKDQSFRMCINYKRLNKCTKRLNYIFPKIEDLTRRLKGMKVFTKLDLKDGYYQVNLHPEDMDLTTFSSHLGMFKFAKLPFGLSNAPILT